MSDRLEVERVCTAALERGRDDRAAFLHAACGGDEALRVEVESLLALESVAGDFLATPALELAAKQIAEEGLSRAGQRIGVYQLVSLLGAGGMGDVFRAHD